MITDADLDRMLAGWLAEGGERAPAADVRAALERVAVTAQRRPVVAWRPWRGPSAPPRWLLVAAAAAILVLLALVAGAGSWLVRLETTVEETPSPSGAVTETSAPSTPAIALRDIRIADFSSAVVSIPAGWQELERPCCDARLLGGAVPRGQLSIGHESPFVTAVCSPDCVQVDVPMTIPYSASTQVATLRARVAEIAGSDRWMDLPAGVLPELVDGALLDTTGVDGEGVEWRRVHIVGLRERNLVAIAWSQPAAAWDAALLQRVLERMELPPAPQYSDGDLAEWRAMGGVFTMPVPDLWLNEDQPEAGGVPVSGIYRAGDGRVLVSIGMRDGTMSWCDPGCRTLQGMTSLIALEDAIGRPAAMDDAAPGLLGGEPASLYAVDEPVQGRLAVTLHRGRPVAVRIDAGNWDVAAGIFDQMLAGFTFTDREPAVGDRVYLRLEGRVELRLDDRWRPSAEDADTFITAVRNLRVRIGARDGTIVTCERPAGPWEQCGSVRVRTLEGLVAAVRPAPVERPGIGLPLSRVDPGVLDGEPAVVVRVEAYEYPARGAQSVAYVVAFHDGLPVIVRYWTSANRISDLEDVISGFRFLDE